MGHPMPRMYAHTLPNRPETEWEPLEDHLRLTAELAARFAAAFGAEEWGRLAGLWHDLGKYQQAFQDLLRGEKRQVEHAGAGAVLAEEWGLRPLAFAIAAHHGGLPNHQARGELANLTPLLDRINGNRHVLDEIRSQIPAGLLAVTKPELPPRLLPGRGSSRSVKEACIRRGELWTRFLFSALVDADRLATESFHHGRMRQPAGFASVAELRERVDARCDSFRGDGWVDVLRARILADCRAAAERPRGIFSLTVPTGGGKTLSGMSFALRHAERHGQRRVIVVIPYTSIIEQNAAEYARTLGAENVIEHHSALDEARAKEEDSEAEVRRKLATENWDAPVIVTTGVQFFETLFSNRASRCRKLHNVAGSVIVLDEAQTLPAEFLTPILDVLRELVDGFGCTVVLSTATQPALARRDALPDGLEGVQEIVRKPAELARALERVRIHWPAPGAEPTPYADVAEALEGHDRVLAVVHRRQDARDLAARLPEEGRFHLSALMCAAHRSETLAQVRRRLAGDGPCRLVSTQLVEAGVDVDFPVVYRALAGLDSLAQAAGRCNRNGRQERGEFVVFRAETAPPRGLAAALGVTESLMTIYGDGLDFSPERFDEFFRMLYMLRNTDARGVQAHRAGMDFETVAALVRLIDDGYNQPVVVPWDDSDERLASYRAAPSRDTLRALQPFLVQVPIYELHHLIDSAAVEAVADGLYALAPQEHLRYDDIFGLQLGSEVVADPEVLTF